MNVVSKDVERLVEKELESANERFPQFHSPHEGMGVLQEEVEEMRHEMIECTVNMLTMWRRVYNNAPTGDLALLVRKHALDAACEAVQVAAMAQKYLDMLERMEKEESE